jgi:hypothetical protein
LAANSKVASILGWSNSAGIWSKIRRATGLRWIALAICLALSLGAFYYARLAEDRRIVEDLGYRSDWRSFNFKSKLAEYVGLVKTLAKLVAKDAPPAQAAFENMATGLLSEDIPARRIGWLQRIDHADRARFEAAETARRGSRFEIGDVDEHGEFVRAADREQYCPILCDIRPSGLPSTASMTQPSM